MGARPCLVKESLTGVRLVSLDNGFARSLAQCAGGIRILPQGDCRHFGRWQLGWELH